LIDKGDSLIIAETLSLPALASQQLHTKDVIRKVEAQKKSPRKNESLFIYYLPEIHSQQTARNVD
jgi:hypothetical protein